MLPISTISAFLTIETLGERLYRLSTSLYNWWYPSNTKSIEDLQFDIIDNEQEIKDIQYNIIKNEKLILEKLKK